MRAAEGPNGTDDAALAKLEEKRTDAYAAQLEAWLRQYLVDQYPQRAATVWHRDYSSIEAFLKSVEPNRAGLAERDQTARRWPRPARSSAWPARAAGRARRPSG